MRIIKALFFKNGKWSKSALFLSSATILVLLLYGFQSLFCGVEFFGWWEIPEFNSQAAGTVLGALAALYVVNHGWVNKDKGPTVEDLTSLREEMNSVVDAVKGRE